MVKCDKQSSLVFSILMRICTSSKPCKTEQLTVLAMAQTTRVAPVKASKNKANLATDELTWRTEIRVLPDQKVAIQKLLPSNHCLI